MRYSSLADTAVHGVGDSDGGSILSSHIDMAGGGEKANLMELDSPFVFFFKSNLRFPQLFFLL